MHSNCWKREAKPGPKHPELATILLVSRRHNYGRSIEPAVRNMHLQMVTSHGVKHLTGAIRGTSPFQGLLLFLYARNAVSNKHACV